MLKAGALIGDSGAEVRDCLADAIRNQSRVVWEGIISGTEFDFPVDAKVFGGVFLRVGDGIRGAAPISTGQCCHRVSSLRHSQFVIIYGVKLEVA